MIEYTEYIVQTQHAGDKEWHLYGAFGSLREARDAYKLLMNESAVDLRILKTIHKTEKVIA